MLLESCTKLQPWFCSLKRIIMTMTTLWGGYSPFHIPDTESQVIAGDPRAGGGDSRSSDPLPQGLQVRREVSDDGDSLLSCLQGFSHVNLSYSKGKRYFKYAVFLLHLFQPESWFSICSESPIEILLSPFLPNQSSKTHSCIVDLLTLLWPSHCLLAPSHLCQRWIPSTVHSLPWKSDVLHHVIAFISCWTPSSSPIPSDLLSWNSLQLARLFYKCNL